MKRVGMGSSNQEIVEALSQNLGNRNENLASFLTMLDYIDGNFSIAIDGKWGSGKTVFVKQIIMLLNYYNSFSNIKPLGLQAVIENRGLKLHDIVLQNNFVPVYFNAWDNDEQDDPTLSLIFSIIQEYNGFSNDTKIKKSIVEKIAAIVDAITPWNSGSFSKLAETFQGDDILLPIKNLEKAKEIVMLLLDELLVEKGDKLVIFIDELDRCNPIYAVKLLEKIKHLFDDERFIFVFSTNLEQLSFVIQNYYGSNFASYRYLEKIFDVMFMMNEISIADYMKLQGIPNDSYHFHSICHYMAKHYSFSMRECNRYIQQIKLVYEYAMKQRSGFSDTNGYNFTLIFFLPVLIAVKMRDVIEFVKIIDGKGKDVFIQILCNDDEVTKRIKRYLRTGDQVNISDDEYILQMGEIYDVIFNNLGSSEYHGSNIELDRNAKKYLMDVVSLLNRKLNYE